MAKLGRFFLSLKAREEWPSGGGVVSEFDISMTIVAWGVE